MVWSWMTSTGAWTGIVTAGMPEVMTDEAGMLMSDDSDALAYGSRCVRACAVSG